MNLSTSPAWLALLQLGPQGVYWADRERFTAAHRDHGNALHRFQVVTFTDAEVGDCDHCGQRGGLLTTHGAPASVLYAGEDYAEAASAFFEAGDELARATRGKNGATP